MIAARYWAFFVSGRVDETTALTLSILHGRRPAAMNAESSSSRKAVETPNEFAIDASDTDL